MDRRKIIRITTMTLGYGMVFAIGLIIIGWPLKGVIISSVFASLIFSALMWKFIPTMKE